MQPGSQSPRRSTGFARHLTVVNRRSLRAARDRGCCSVPPGRWVRPVPVPGSGGRAVLVGPGQDQPQENYANGVQRSCRPCAAAGARLAPRPAKPGPPYDTGPRSPDQEEGSSPPEVMPKQESSTGAEGMHCPRPGGRFSGRPKGRATDRAPQVAESPPTLGSGGRIPAFLGRRLLADRGRAGDKRDAGGVATTSQAASVCCATDPPS